MPGIAERPAVIKEMRKGMIWSHSNAEKEEKKPAKPTTRAMLLQVLSWRKR